MMFQQTKTVGLLTSAEAEPDTEVICDGWHCDCATMYLEELILQPEPLYLVC